MSEPIVKVRNLRTGFDIEYRYRPAKSPVVFLIARKRQS